MTKVLNVWWNGTLVGRLDQTKGGTLKFTYDQDWLGRDKASSLSLSLPKRVLTFKEKECRPFFGGLLPEEEQRRRAAAALGVSASNDFALLEGLGEDVAGAIELLPPEISPPRDGVNVQTHPLTDEELVAVINKLPMRPLLAGEEGLRLSLAGAQAKLPVVLVDRDVALPLPGQPTTHILKPPIPQYQGSTENEALVMKLARAIRLDVAEVEPRIVGNKSFLLVTRYDRRWQAGGPIERLHQEDFYQALGILSHRKYAKEGGPAFKECFGLIRTASTMPGRDVLTLIDAALFNLIVGNADAHGKNFSILYRTEQTRLAPLYDLLSTAHYPGLSPDMAMKFGRAGRLEDLDEDHWRHFSNDTGIPTPHIRRRGHELCEKIAQHLPLVEEELLSIGLDGTHLSAIRRTISNRLAFASVKLPKVKARARPRP